MDGQLLWIIFLLFLHLSPMSAKDGSVVTESSYMDRTEIINATMLTEKMLHPSHYDRKARPYAGEKPVDVYLSIGVQSFTSIKETNMEFTTSMFLRQEWTDIRLAHGLDGTISLGGKDVDMIWRPDTYINNNNDYELHQENQLALISKYGEVYFSARMLVRASCQMYLQNFPMDVQKCSLILESFAYTNNHVAFHWKGRNPIKIFNKELAEFDMDRWEIEKIDQTYVAGPYRNLIVSFTFRRRLGFYLINFYVPCIVMVIMSWIVFWMDCNSIGERISLGITTILTIVFLLGSSNSTMPRVSYPKMIDWYLMGSFLFVFTTLIMCLLIFMLNQITRKEKVSLNLSLDQEEQQIQRQLSMNSIQMSPVTTPDDHEHDLKNHISHYIADSQGAVYPIMRSRINPKKGKLVVNHSLPKTLCGIGSRSSNGEIDIVFNKMCRIMFPLAFLVFNAVYWSVLAS